MNTEQPAPAALADLPPFHEGLFDTGSHGLRLRGARCAACGHTFYPFTPTCLSCLAADVENIPLNREGILESFTTVHMPAGNIAPPYTVGYVKLPERLRIFAPLEPGEHVLRIGMPMRVHPFALGSARGPALAYCFKPVGS